MNPRARIACVGLTSAALALGGVSAAAAAARPLTDGQLDDVSAGGAAAAVASANATGLFTITQTNTAAFVTPFSGGAGGVALAVGTNVGFPGPAATSATNVQTFVTVDNPRAVVVANVNYTTTGAGGLVLQVAWIYTYSPGYVL
jgi:hypothetical protein